MPAAAAFSAIAMVVISFVAMRAGRDFDAAWLGWMAPVWLLPVFGIFGARNKKSCAPPQDGEGPPGRSSARIARRRERDRRRADKREKRASRRGRKTRS